MEDRGPLVGVDVSKDRLDVRVRAAGERLAVSRDATGMVVLRRGLVELGPAAVALEATGGFEAGVTATLAGAGLPVVVLNPAQVRSFALALGRRAKTEDRKSVV